MIGALAAGGLLASVAWAAPVGLDRVDVLSEDPGTFLDEHVARWGPSPTVTSIRFAEQLKVVIRTPVRHLHLGLSAASQSLVWEPPLRWGLGLTAGVQTRWALPRGGVLGVHYRRGPLRFGLSANLLSGATWTRGDWSQWRVLPGVGVGFGPARKEPAPPHVWGDPLRR